MKDKKFEAFLEIVVDNIREDKLTPIQEAELINHIKEFNKK